MLAPAAAGARLVASVGGMEPIEEFIDQLPKAEMHLHLVGSASVPTVLELARRHPGGPVPRTEEELRAFFAFRDFPHFAQVYAAVSALVRERPTWPRWWPGRRVTWPGRTAGTPS